MTYDNKDFIPGPLVMLILWMMTMMMEMTTMMAMMTYDNKDFIPGPLVVPAVG